jgi:ribosomal protein L35
MPKMKSKGSVKKRFRVSKNGKVMCSRTGRGHGHSAFKGKTGRRLRRPLVLNHRWSVLVAQMLGSKR